MSKTSCENGVFVIQYGYIKVKARHGYGFDG